PRERAYLDAVEILYGDGPKARRDTAYSRAMERLVARFPADREAQVFYAASLLGLSQGVRNVPTYMRAATIVGRVFRDNPDHAGSRPLHPVARIRVPAAGPVRGCAAPSRTDARQRGQGPPGPRRARIDARRIRREHRAMEQPIPTVAHRPHGGTGARRGR